MQVSASLASQDKSSTGEPVTWYHWLVVIIASAGWLFDCMDQRLFVLARESALKELLGPETAAEIVKKYIGYATTSMILGWATGGILFGMLSDKWGRVKTMVATLMVYSGFTGLCGLAQSWVDFTIYRFLVGLGVGGMFGAATTLVAESVPGRVRAVALGTLQALSAVGNMMGSLISLWIQPGATHFWGDWSGWRVLFFVGILPALLAAPMLLVLREPEAWKRARELARSGVGERKVGSIRDLFGHSRWRRRAIIGLLLGVSGMVGLWGIGFFSPELISTALRGAPQSTVDTVRGWGTFFQDLGAFAGMTAFTVVAAWLSRRLAFFLAFMLCLITTAFVFLNLRSATDAYWMLPMMGFAQLAVFAGYSIYFPELFPTRLRGTGVGFCYNTVRYLAAPAPMVLGQLSASLGAHGVAEPFRVAAVIMCSVYVIGIVALIWAPETKGRPLPED
ncbi:MAG: MFS transporter [Verrucomicrobiota bacterium]|nr:MFS transporter [Limisphaera sp.]MDW8382312.1 MFS transporter [Verrucomicrobiota bacterium]